MYLCTICNSCFPTSTFYGHGLWLAHYKLSTTHTTMVSCATLPSDLDLIHNLPDKSDSDDDFDGYLDPEDGPIVYCSTVELEDEAICS